VLIGKRVVDFLLVLIELFSLGVTAEALRANRKSAISLRWGPVDPKFQVEGVATPTIRFLRKTRLNVLSYGIKIWTDLSSVLSQSTRLTDEQTDRNFIASAVKTVNEELSSTVLGSEFQTAGALYTLPQVRGRLPNRRAWPPFGQ